MQYRKKPIVIDAVQWDGSNLTEIAMLGGGREYEQDFLSDDLVIHTLEGDITATKGDWIIRGVKGELYPCKPDIFDATYEKVEGRSCDICGVQEPEHWLGKTEADEILCKKCYNNPL